MFFTFNGVSSQELGLRVTNMPFDFMAQRRVSETVIERYDGTVYSDRDTFDSVPYDIECIILDNFSIENINKIKEVFKGGKGDLILSHKPNYIYKARLVSSINFIEMIQHTGSCMISFKLEPLGFIASGQAYQQVSNGMELVNLGNHYAMPIFQVNGVGTIILTINDSDMRFDGVEEAFFVDMELEDIYSVSEPHKNLNRYLKLEHDFINLKEGSNRISFTGASSIRIKPRWRAL